MQYLKIILFSLLFFLSFVDLTAQSKSKIIAKGAQVKQLSADYTFTEGPAVDAQGNVFFTDQPNDRIIKCDLQGNVSVYMEKTGRSNGLYFDHEGNLLACADENNQLWKIDKNKKVEILVKDFEGEKLNGPNDLWVDAKGGIYFTDPYYKRKYWKRSQDQIEERVYYLSPDKKRLKVVAAQFERPNGIIGSKDGKKLYVADIGDNKTYVFDIEEDAGLSNRRLFVELGSDGMTLDHKGNLYLTGKGVTVFNKKGKQIEHIPIDENWTANVCFGGEGQKTLFITAMKSLYSLEMKVRGIR